MTQTATKAAAEQKAAADMLTTAARAQRERANQASAASEQVRQLADMRSMGPQPPAGNPINGVNSHMGGLGHPDAAAYSAQMKAFAGAGGVGGMLARAPCSGGNF